MNITRNSVHLAGLCSETRFPMSYGCSPVVDVVVNTGWFRISVPASSGVSLLQIRNHSTAYIWLRNDWSLAYSHYWVFDI